MIIDVYCPPNLYEYKISNRFFSWFCCYSYLKMDARLIKND